MFNEITAGKLRRVARLLAVAGPLGACAGGLITEAPALQVAIAGGESEAQLIRQLEAQGYDDVRVTEFRPNNVDRRPELMHAFRSADDEAAQVTPVHVGWNGTAVKDGRTFDVYVTQASLR
jgi:hypothetical protein